MYPRGLAYQSEIQKEHMNLQYICFFRNKKRDYGAIITKSSEPSNGSVPSTFTS